ncbi:MAG: two-component system response regulator, partial [Gemmatimonadetes bacterium]
VRTLDDVIRDHVAETLAACGGNKTEAARRLGIGRSRLQRAIERYGLD